MLNYFESVKSFAALKFGVLIIQSLMYYEVILISWNEWLFGSLFLASTLQYYLKDFNMFGWSVETRLADLLLVLLIEEVEMITHFIPFSNLSSSPPTTRFQTPFQSLSLTVMVYTRHQQICHFHLILNSKHPVIYHLGSLFNCVLLTVVPSANDQLMKHFIRI